VDRGCSSPTILLPQNENPAAEERAPALPTWQYSSELFLYKNFYFSKLFFQSSATTTTKTINQS
jgi:hypothetical protein